MRRSDGRGRVHGPAPNRRHVASEDAFDPALERALGRRADLGRADLAILEQDHRRENGQCRTTAEDRETGDDLAKQWSHLLANWRKEVGGRQRDRELAGEDHADGGSSQDGSRTVKSHSRSGEDSRQQAEANDHIDPVTTIPHFTDGQKHAGICQREKRNSREQTTHGLRRDLNFDQCACISPVGVYSGSRSSTFLSRLSGLQGR